MSRTPFENLAFILAEIRKSAEAGNWETAARTFAQLAEQIEAGRMPPASEADRAAIESCQAHLESLSERATALHKDIGTLLKAFGGTGKNAAA
ncbi:MAG: hypothetical protein LBB55_02250 [Zoogloeaceae bacterium]|jgi:hypothetical protein|nr:hypothetical protein [Zoogloeaceae bacterium]